MICNNCHQEIGNASGLCPICGAAIAPPQQPQPKQSKKGLKIGLGIAAVVAVVAAGWFFLRGSSGSDLEKMIPATASAVLRVDAAQLAEEIGLEIDGNDIKLPKRVMELTGAKASDIQEFMGKIKDSGINPLGSIYGFTTNESLNAALIVPLFDQDKAKAFIEKEAEIKFSTIDNGYYIVENGAIMMIKNKALLIGAAKDKSDGLKEMASLLMDGKQESIAKKGDITSALHNGKAVGLYVDNQKIQHLANDIPEYKQAMRNNPFAPLMSSINSTSMGLDVGGNELTLTSDITTKDKDYETFMNNAFQQASNDFLDYMPAGCNLMAAIGVNGKKIASMEQIAFLLNELPAEMKSVIESLNGTIAAGACFDPSNPGTIGFRVLIGSENPDKLLPYVNMFTMAALDGVNVGVVGKYVYVSTTGNVNKGEFKAPAECKDLFKNSWMALYGSIDISSFEFNFLQSVSSAKKSKLTFYVNENGKKMKPIEWPVAFAEVQKQFKAFDNYSSSDFAYDDETDMSDEADMSDFSSPLSEDF